MNRADLRIPGIEDRLQGQYEPNMMWTELVNAKHEASQIQNGFAKLQREVREHRPYSSRESYSAYRARMEQLCNAATGKEYRTRNPEDYQAKE